MVITNSTNRYRPIHPSHCTHSLEYWLIVSFIYGYPIFKWVAVTWTKWSGTGITLSTMTIWPHVPLRQTCPFREPIWLVCRSWININLLSKCFGIPQCLSPMFYHSFHSGLGLKWTLNSEHILLFVWAISIPSPMHLNPKLPVSSEVPASMINVVVCAIVLVFNFWFYGHISENSFISPWYHCHNVLCVMFVCFPVFSFRQSRS